MRLYVIESLAWKINVDIDAAVVAFFSAAFLIEKGYYYVLWTIMSDK
jgi:hypothetical protein